MSKEAMKLALEAAYLAGFNSSGEGYNGEYPFQDHNAHPEHDVVWVKDRDNYVSKALAEQSAQEAELRRLVSFNNDLMDEVARLQKREWVGLTPDDIRQLEKENTVGGYHGDYCPTWDLIESVEAFLREKNT